MWWCGLAEQLSTYTPSADDGEKKGENFLEICKKELAGKAGLREKGW